MLINLQLIIIIETKFSSKCTLGSGVLLCQYEGICVSIYLNVCLVEESMLAPGVCSPTEGERESSGLRPADFVQHLAAFRQLSGSKHTNTIWFLCSRCRMKVIRGTLKVQEILSLIFVNVFSIAFEMLCNQMEEKKDLYKLILHKMLDCN